MELVYQLERRRWKDDEWTITQISTTKMVQELNNLVYKTEIR